MILAIDAYYSNSIAKVVGIVFERWDSDKPLQSISTTVLNIPEYESGEFYKRELPCIIELLVHIDLKYIETIIIDGYVYLDDNCRPGLGVFLYEHLLKRFPIIGIAKKPFYKNKSNVKELLRGKSKNPLYVTSIGISLEEAVELINKMHGEYRIPTLLKMLDIETRT